MDERRNGTRRLYRVRPEGMAELRAFLEEFWDSAPRCAQTGSRTRGEGEGWKRHATTEAPVYERELQIDASPETVWEFLVDPEKVARWKGLPATAFDPQPGGAYRIEIVPGRVASGAFVELERPRRLVYTWGWEPGPEGPNPVPPGSSTVEIELEPWTAARGCVHPSRPARRRGRAVACRGLGSLPRRGSSRRRRAATPGATRGSESLPDRGRSAHVAKPTTKGARRWGSTCTPTRAAGCPRARRKASGSWRPGRPGSAASATPSWTWGTRSAPPPRSAVGRRRGSPATRS